MLLDGLQLVTEITEINASPFRCPPSLGLQPSLIPITFPTQANAALSFLRLFLTQLPAFAAPTNTAARKVGRVRRKEREGAHAALESGVPLKIYD